MNDPLTILLTADFYDAYLTRLQELSPPEWRWRRLPYPLASEAERDLHDVDVLVSREDIPERAYETAPRLKLFQLVTAGYDHIRPELARRFGIPLCNNGGANAIAVAEHVFLFMLALYRQFLFHHNAVMHGPWVNRKYENRELYNKIIGIVGCGNVGSQVARRAACFGMTVLYTDPVPRSAAEEKLWNMERVEIDELLARSDIVTYHVPLNQTTRGMLNDDAIAAMKTGVLLLNTSRGPVHEESALVRGLQSGKLGGLGLDVFSAEPLAEDSALRQFSNVVFSPHSGPSRETIDRVIHNVVDNCRRISCGLAPQFIVNNCNA